MEKIGLIDTGGGQRGAFGAGVLDWCNHHHIIFDQCIGVSAGAGNLVSFLAQQPGRNLRFYLDYSLRKEYMSYSNFRHKGSYIDLDYVYSKITNEDGEDPLDYNAFMRSPSNLTVVATHAETGLPVYLTKDDFPRNDYWPLKASSCMPLVCRAVKRNGSHFFDGGLSDPVPLQKLIQSGCTRIVVILTRPLDFRRKQGADVHFARLLRLQYPRSANALRYRWKMYNTAIEDLQTAAITRQILILAPDTIGTLKTLSRDPAALQRLYWRGYTAAEQIAPFLDCTEEETK